MKKSPLMVWLGAAALLVSACNFYNPGGTGDASGNRVAAGDELFRQGKFAQAMAEYSLAIKEDSTLSAAYFGYFKATLRFHDLDNMATLRDLDSTNKDTSAAKKIYLLRPEQQELMTRRLNASNDARRILEILQDRDSLTLAFRYIRDTSAATRAKDPNHAARRAFILDYLEKAEAGVPGYRPASQFPLTDGRKTFAKLKDDYDLMQGLSSISNLYDIDGNGVIDFGTADSSGLKFNLSANGTLDAKALLTDMQNNPALAVTLNGKLTTAGSDLTQLTASINANKGGDDSTSSEEVGAFAASLGDALSFYQWDDKKDNDGDGCIDEEIMDEKDNDGDGFIDEDARITVLPQDNLDNDNKNGVDDAGENVGSDFLLNFVATWQTANPGQEFILIKKGASNIKARIDLQKDSLALPSRRLQAGYATKLANAKTLIGGCWHNYTAPSPKRASK